MTHTEIQQAIMKLLQWDAAVYSSFMYNCGLNYLEKYIGPDEEAISMLTPKQQYWNWWKNLFTIRDAVFFDEYEHEEISLDDLRSQYRELHNPAVLACEIHPPSYVYGNDFTHVKMATA